MTPSTLATDIGFVTSFRDFSRNTSIRKKALKKKQPIVVEDRREKEFFFLVPPEMYQGLREMYEDWRDSHQIREAQAENLEKSGKPWNTLRSELLDS